MKKHFNVLVTRRLHRSALEELSKKCNVMLHSGKIPIPKKILMNKIKNSDGLICHPYDTIDKEVIQVAKNLRIISTFSVGFDHIDIDFAKSQGIRIGYTPEVLTNATAELTRVDKTSKKLGKDFIQLTGNDDNGLEFNKKGGVGAISVTANIAPKV